MKVYVVRHGQTDSNILHIYNVITEDLNEIGVKQIEELKTKTDKLDYDLIICSPLLRARHTADIINSNNKEIIYDKRIEERHHGSLAGKTFNREDKDIQWNYYNKKLYGTEEKITDLLKRVYEFFDELKNKNYENVLLVTHSGVSRIIETYFNGIPEDGCLIPLGMKNGEIREYVL